MNSQLVGTTGVFHVAAELSMRGLVALPSIRNVKGADILVADPDGKRFAFLQVKTSQHKVTFWPIGEGARKWTSKDSYYAFVRRVHGRFEVFLEHASVVAREAVDAENKALARGNKKMGPRMAYIGNGRGEGRRRTHSPPVGNVRFRPEESRMMADKRVGKRGRPKGTTKAGLKYLDEGQLKAFFQAVRKTKDPTRRLRDDLIFSLIVFYGLRVSELAGLRMGDLDLRGRQLRVAAAKGGLTRTEDIPADIWRKLEAWLKKKDEGEWLFPGRLPGRPMSTDRLKALFKEVAGRAGLPKDFSVHSLRHTTAIMMAARGASPIRIKTWLRHKRVSSSERYFEQVRFSDTGKKMEGIFGDIL